MPKLGRCHECDTHLLFVLVFKTLKLIPFCTTCQAYKTLTGKQRKAEPKKMAHQALFLLAS